MNKKMQFIIAIFMVLPMLSMANPIKKKWDYEKTKTIKKDFDVNADALLNIKNKYGNVDVVSWNQNRIEIEVIITVSGNNESKVIERLSKINVNFENSRSAVSAKTSIENKSKNWYNSGNKMNYEINYKVKVPVTNSVDLNNDYGTISLNEIKGRAEINCDYGKITTKELMSGNNIINFDYTNNSYFEYIKGGKINADYSGFTIGKTESLTIVADYTKSHVEIAEDINYNCDYGGLTIDKVNNVTGNGDYLTTKIGDVYKNIEIKGDYGSLKINNMTDNAGDINIESDYMNITIGYASNYSFNFDIDLEYASLRGEDNFEITKQKIESGDKYYAGYYGNDSSGNTIKISSDYGSVTFKNN